MVECEGGGYRILFYTPVDVVDRVTAGYLGVFTHFILGGQVGKSSQGERCYNDFVGTDVKASWLLKTLPCVLCVCVRVCSVCAC